MWNIILGRFNLFKIKAELDFHIFLKWTDYYFVWLQIVFKNSHLVNLKTLQPKVTIFRYTLKCSFIMKIEIQLKNFSNLRKKRVLLMVTDCSMENGSCQTHLNFTSLCVLVNKYVVQVFSFSIFPVGIFYLQQI